jgi:hypothetical protein
MLVEGLVAFLCAGGICTLVPSSTWYKKHTIKKDWEKIMKITKTKNNIDETFEITGINLYKNGSIDIKTKIPVGLTPENLYNLEKTIEYHFGGDIAVKWDKYNGSVLVRINKDPKVLEQHIKNKWTEILSGKDIKGRFGQYFEVTDIALNNNYTYILTLRTPISLSKESLLHLKKLVGDSLKDEIIESFHNESNNIFITISHKQRNDFQNT